MVVWMALAVTVNESPEDGVCHRVALALNLPVAVDEGMAALRGADGVHHNGEVATGRVLHSGGDVKAACGEAVLLVFYASGSYGYVGEKV